MNSFSVLAGPALDSLVSLTGLKSENLTQKLPEIYNDFVGHFLSQLDEGGRSRTHLCAPERKPGDFTYVVDGNRKDPKTPGKFLEGTSAIATFFRHHKYVDVTVKEDGHEYHKVWNTLGLLFINGDTKGVQLSDLVSGAKSLKHRVAQMMTDLAPFNTGGFEVLNGATPHVLGIRCIAPVISGAPAPTTDVIPAVAKILYAKPKKATKPKVVAPVRVPAPANGGGAGAPCVSDRKALVAELAKYASLPDDVLMAMRNAGVIPDHIVAFLGL